jgi:hypothetical protein
LEPIEQWELLFEVGLLDAISGTHLFLVSLFDLEAMDAP